jgi:cAMP-dependent protein kinase regulator
MEPVEFSDGEAIVEQGQPGDQFFIIYSGEANVTKLDPETNEEIQVNTLKSGDYFGELALLTDQPRAATVTANGDVVCVSLNPQAFVRLFGPCMELLKRHAHLYSKYKVSSIF